MSDLTSRLYAHSPIWLQNLLISSYGAVLRHRRHGGIHRSHLRWLQRTQWIDRDEIAALQLRLLNRQLEIAARVPIHRDKNLPTRLERIEELRSLPLLRKQELRRPRNELTPPDIPGRVLEIHTGGTTGSPLTVYCTSSALQRNYAFFERFKGWAIGEVEHPRIATFAGRTVVPAEQKDPPFWRYNLAAATMLFSSYHLSEATLPQYVHALHEFGPALIDSYPSSIEPLSRYLLENGSPSIRPRAIITSSETLGESVRELFEAAFECPVFDHYGAAEMAALITQCERGTYHPNPEFGIVEILRDGRPVAPGETGEIVATGFINDAMPLIRYATGDHAVRSDALCPCGRAFPVVQRIEGRRDDVLETPDGRLIGRLDPVFKKVDSFFETRLIQTTPTHVRVETVPAAAYDPKDEKVLLAELKRRLGPSMTVELVKVSSIPRTESGKFRAVINQVPRRAEDR